VTDAVAGVAAESNVDAQSRSLAGTLRHFLPVLVALAAFGVASSIATPYPVGIFHDDGVYLILAKALAAGDGYRYLHLPGAPLATHYPPIYPVLLAVLWKLAPDFPRNISLLLLVNAALLGWLAMSLDRFGYRRLGWPRWTAVVTALVGTLSLPMLFLSSLVMSEVLFLALAIPLLLASESAVEAEQPRAAADVLLGASAGALVLVRAHAVALPLAMMVWLVCRRRWARATRYAGAALVVLIPWQLWVALHDSALPATLHGSYGSYLGWFTDGLSQGGLTFVWHTVRTNLLEVAALVADRVAPWPAGWTRILPLMVWLILAGWGAVRLRPRAPVTLLFLVFYLGATLVWPYAPWRFVWAIWPLLVLLLVEGCFAIAQPARGMGASAWRGVAFATIALMVIGVARAEVGVWRDRAWQTPVRAAAGQIGPIVRWAANETSPNDLLVADDEPLVYLMTGRRALPPVQFTAIEYVGGGPGGVDAARTALRTLIERYPVKYVLTVVPTTREAARALTLAPERMLREQATLAGGRGAVFEVVRP
jgi:hypothetical protein